MTKRLQQRAEGIALITSKTSSRVTLMDMVKLHRPKMAKRMYLGIIYAVTTSPTETVSRALGWPQWCQFLPSLAHFWLWAVPLITGGLWTVSPCTGVYFVAFEPSCWCITTVPRVGSLDLA